MFFRKRTEAITAAKSILELSMDSIRRHPRCDVQSTLETNVIPAQAGIQPQRTGLHPHT
ncbi:MAG TPA: hypothetical protein P5569_14155 [Candidatus Latescibacteria bacterium]|nr:hypothetical protein [Candidatus Latescibacterota bacterium]